MRKYNCAACHELPHIGGEYVVPLEGIGERMNRVQLFRWLSDPREVKPDTRMPDFMFEPEQAADLTDYLLTFRTLADGSVMPPPPDYLVNVLDNPDRIENGGRIFREARCISCHTVEGKGGAIAEEIGSSGTLYTPRWLWQYLSNPKRLLPGVPMPRYGLPSDQLLDLTTYLLSELQDWDFDSAAYKVPEPRHGYFERGEVLWTTYNCAGCHSLKGAPTEGEKGPSLAKIGVKPSYNLEMGVRNDLPQDLPVYLLAKLQNPRSFFENLRMPQYDFNPEEADAIVTALLAFGDEENLPDEWLVIRDDPAKPKLNGAIGRLFDRYNCLTCHSLNGYGGTMAPELSALGSQLAPDWIRKYLLLPYSRRPILTERMPNLFIPITDADTLREYIQLILVSDELDSITTPERGNPVLIERGKALFHEKFACRACHQVDGKGGYVGPPLDGAGERLQPGWLKAWLADPQNAGASTQLSRIWRQRSLRCPPSQPIL